MKHEGTGDHSPKDSPNDLVIIQEYLGLTPFSRPNIVGDKRSIPQSMLIKYPIGILLLMIKVDC